MSGLPDPIFLVTPDLVIADANAAGLRLVGLETVEGVRLASVLATSEPELRTSFHDWVRSRSPTPGRLSWKTAAGLLSVPLEAWCATPPGRSPKAVILRCTPADNIVDRFLLLNDQLKALQREVLARKHVEAQLSDAIRARYEFIAIAAHELRTPLNVFHLSLQVLYRRAHGDEKIREIIDKSQFQLNRLQMLVERVLDVSRIRSGQFELNRGTFDLNHLIAEIVGRFVQEFAGIEIMIDSATAAVGNWDRLRIDQAITNLISNAIKYGEGKPIKIALTTAGGEAFLRITDQGIGLSREDILRIFNKFERAAPRSNSEGFGLGLWITRQIAEAHNGSILAYGELGKGATFTLRLPL
ncbi:MAG: HAMP domain-containing sensor histidine kinase [Candidatus Binataceae bacterium]